jgi:hypothetical protein
MSIDGIGKRPPPAPAVSSGPVEGPASAGPAGPPAAPFELDPGRRASGPSGAPPAEGVVSASNSSLDQLRAGRIDLGRYLDLKVDEATAHLAALPRIELDAIRTALRERLATDPALVDLVRVVAAAGAAGGAPPAPEDS